MQDSLPLSNVPEYGVSDLAFSLKKTLEDSYGRVRVRGELGRLTFAGSGHMYGNLKDDRSSLDVICWRSTVPKLSVRPEEGMEVICTGKITTYPARSNYQLIIDSIELAGEGALLKLLEQRKQKLAAEGVFGPERKKQIPFLPQTIGVITSPTGAVIRDILHRIQERFPVRVLVWPVRVQGDQAASEVLAALKGFQQLADKPDTLIIARGGGSLEDLMPFNDEALTRAVADCRIPIITAVGHETDTTLVDYAADIRAPTPTAAAEFAVPVRSQLHAQVLDGEQRLGGAMQRMLTQQRRHLETQRLGDPASLINMKAQALDHITHKLQTGFSNRLNKSRERLLNAGARLRHPQQVVDDRTRTLKGYDERLNALSKNMLQGKRDNLSAVGRIPHPEPQIAEKHRRLVQITERLTPLPERLIKQKQDHLAGQDRLLESLSFKGVLQRGFVLVRDSDTGAPLTDPSTIHNDQILDLQFKDDKIIRVKKAES